MPPIISVESITYRDQSDNQQTLSDITVSGLGSTDHCIIAPVSRWPSGKTVSVEFTAGFGDDAEAVPEDILVVLDEAYGETAPPGTLPPANLIRPNLFRTRTFSKAYGLAGIRCGYAIADAETVGYLDRIRNHYGVNRLAQAAGVAAIADQDWLQKVVGWNAAARERILSIAAANGLEAIPSGANFVTIHCGRDGPFAQRVLRALSGDGVFIRKPSTPGLDRYIRISTGPDDELDIFAEMLPKALADAAV